MERLHIKVSGDVIGIGFRNFVKHHASRLGVLGYVKNLNNQVEIVLEANSMLIEKLLELIRRGPPGSKITNLDIKKEEFKNEFKTFEIRF